MAREADGSAPLTVATVPAATEPRPVRPDELRQLIAGMRRDAVLGAALGALAPVLASAWFGPVFGVFFGVLGGFFAGLTLVDAGVHWRVRRLGLPKGTVELFHRFPVRAAFAHRGEDGDEIEAQLLAGAFRFGASGLKSRRGPSPGG